MNRFVAAAVALLGTTAAVASVLMADPGQGRLDAAAVAVVVAAYGAVGALICWHRPGHPVGRLVLAASAVWGVGEALLAAGYRTLADQPDDRVAALAAVLGSTARGVGWLMLVLWLPLLFPDGVPQHRTRLRTWATWCSRVSTVTFLGFALLSPHQTDLRLDAVDNPLGLPEQLTVVADALALTFLATGAVAVLLVVAVLVQQWRHQEGLGRQQTLWLALAFVPPIVLMLIGEGGAPWMYALVTLPVPVALAVAILQRRLYDIQLVVNRSLTYVALSVVIALLYAVVVGGVGALLRQEDATWLPWLAAGAVAVAFAPVRDALQHGANRVVYGRWSQPAEVLADTGRRVRDATDMTRLLDSLVDEIGTGLALGYVEVLTPDGRSVAKHGVPVGDVDELPMTAYGEQVGRLRWSRQRMRESDRMLLEDLARQLGAVVHAATLLDQLRSAQERLVLGREEERKRVRRELHDGLGPTLAALTLRVDLLRNQVADGAALNGALDGRLLELREVIQAAVVDVRRIVEGLRPPALDELGLVDAVRQLAARLSASGRACIAVEAQPLPRLSAAAEVAAYRIVQEALTNAVRHADAQQVVVHLSVEEVLLQVRICDDGTGRVRPRPGGVGLASMRERADEIGGEFHLDAVPGHGTTVVASLPCRVEVPT